MSLSRIRRRRCLSRSPSLTGSRRRCTRAASSVSRSISIRCGRAMFRISESPTRLRWGLRRGLLRRFRTLSKRGASSPKLQTWPRTMTTTTTTTRTRTRTRRLVASVP
eukprot:Amastigsp_a174400_653.p4 type:complete len:108 gc:universal Amastigsp_a174400_653:639-316(-)